MMVAGRSFTLIDRSMRPKAWMDVAKGVAMFLVVFFHTSLYFSEAEITNFPGRIKQFLESFPMPAFMLLSGMFALRVGTWTFSQVWVRRLFPLLWLYVVWSLVRFVFYWVVPGTNGDLGALPATDPRSILLLLVWPSNSYWFLYSMFWFTLGVWALRQVPVWLKLTGATLLSTAITCGVLNLHNLGWNRTATLFLFFLIGAIFSRRIADWVQRATPWTAAILLAGYLLLAMIITLIPGARSWPFAITALQVLAVAAGFVFCKYLAPVVPLRRVFGTIGEWSLQVYLLHLFIIVSLAALLQALLPPIGGAIGMGIVTIASVITTFVAIMLSKLTTKVRWLYVPPMKLLQRMRTTNRSAGG